MNGSPRRWRAIFFALAMMFSIAGVCTAAAQDRETTEVRTRVVRAPEGSLRRGALPLPSWAVYAGAGALVGAAAMALAWRAAKRR